jgi:3-phenylpropionate/trans-cinnamate dioxygenase ferredoxin reductase subunit
MSARNKPLSLNPESHVLIVGASLGGLRAAEALRGLGFTGAITLVGAERYMPYNRPPLSKELLLGNADGAAAMAEIAFRPKATIADVTWRLGVPVVAADLDAGRLQLGDGTWIAFDALIAATGLRPRRLPMGGAEADRFVLRSFEDALALRKRLVPGVRVAVVGGGFIGCEVAATARQRGCEVLVIEPLAAPMQRALGAELGTALRAAHEEAGIVFHLGRNVTAFETRDGKLRALVLDDGSVVAADLAVEAVGSHYNVDWLEGNGLDLGDGILCDDRMAVHGCERVAAIGDVARFPNALLDDVPRRIEHWSVPAITARRAAEHIVHCLGGAAPKAVPFAPLPTFWSDQLGLRIQSAGMPGLADRCEIVAGSWALPELRADGVLVSYWRAHRQIGIVGVGVPPARFAMAQGQLAKAMQ